MTTPGYTVLSTAVASTSEEKNSDFLTFLQPVASRAEAIAHIDHYRQLHPSANHVCWAYIIGNTRQPLTQAFSDDGEPSGTAGKPILHVLTEREVGNALALVVRYFGGVKLGAGGLVRAYSGAVSAAVNLAELKQLTPRVNLKVQVDFAQEAKIRYLLAQYDGQLQTVVYGNQVILEVALAQTQLDDFRSQIIEATAGVALIAVVGSQLPNSV